MVKVFSFAHEHHEGDRITAFSEASQKLLGAAMDADTPFVVVPHVPSRGVDAGNRVFYKVNFGKKTVTKCDADGTPIPGKWRGAPMGATYTHRLIIESVPEPPAEAPAEALSEPLPLPAAAGGGGGAPRFLNDIADDLRWDFMRLARKIAVHRQVARVYTDYQMFPEGDRVREEVADLMEHFIERSIKGYLETALQTLR